jgi:hypothetical protein
MWRDHLPLQETHCLAQLTPRYFRAECLSFLKRATAPHLFPKEQSLVSLSLSTQVVDECNSQITHSISRFLVKLNARIRQ